MKGMRPMSDLMLRSSAVISDCKFYRYRLDRDVQESGIVFAFFGVNGSTAGPIEEDQTTLKWRGFTLRNAGRKYIAGNPFGYRARDVRILATIADPVGPENDKHLGEIIAEADVLVPCWGNATKVPGSIRHHIYALADRIVKAGKPVKIFGFTQNGDPQHPLMLGYDTPLIDWKGYGR